MQDCINSSALALELLQFCIKPSIFINQNTSHITLHVPVLVLVINHASRSHGSLQFQAICRHITNWRVKHVVFELTLALCYCVSPLCIRLMTWCKTTKSVLTNGYDVPKSLGMNYFFKNISLNLSQIFYLHFTDFHDSCGTWLFLLFCRKMEKKVSCDLFVIHYEPLRDWARLVMTWPWHICSKVRTFPTMLLDINSFDGCVSWYGQ